MPNTTTNNQEIGVKTRYAVMALLLNVSRFANGLSIVDKEYGLV